jgi:hypothetical protein
MHSNDLTNDQLEALMKKLRPMQFWLGRLKERMVAQGFLPHDELFQLVDKAHNSLHHLFVDLHYRSVEASKQECESRR